MKNLKRYEHNYDFNGCLDMEESSEGEWVKFSDIKEILKTPTNISSMPLDHKCSTCGNERYTIKCSGCGKETSVV